MLDPKEGASRRRAGNKARPLERLLANAVRSAHIAAVVVLGAALLGAPLPVPAASWAVAGSGAVLLALDLAAARMHLGEVAGVAVLFKLALLIAAAWQPTWAATIFFAVLLLSSLVAHAPKGWRHRRLRPRCGMSAGACEAGPAATAREP
jgi:hypothetical protein